MGGNDQGQLGLNEPYVEFKQSPMLIDSLLNLKPQGISCGANHTLVHTKSGDVFAWGSNEYGQCGTTTGIKIHKHHQPTVVNFDQYYKPVIRSVSGGGYHSGFIDDIGRLFVCGRNNMGQLGLGNTNQENVPYYVERVPDKIAEVACGY